MPLVAESLRAFAAAEKRSGLPPSVRDFGRELGITATPAYRRLLILEEGRYLRRSKKRGLRMWELTTKGKRALT